MVRRGGWVLIAVAALLAAPLGCAEKRSGGGGSDDAGPPPDSGPPPGPSYPVRIVDAFSREPIAGATVALDLPGRARVELTSDAEGRVTFPNVNPASDTPTITAAAPDHALTTFASLDTDFRLILREAMLEDAGTLLIPLRPRRTAETFVELSGMATNMLATTNNLSLFPSLPLGSEHNGTGTAWMLSVPSGQPFQVVALEWTNVMTTTVGPRGREYSLQQWKVIESPGVTAPGTLPVDFATPAMTTVATGSFAIPTGGGASFFARAIPGVSVTERGGRLLLGVARRIDVSAEGTTATYEIEYVPPPGALQADTTYALVIAPESSIVVERGLPRADHAPEFLAPPTVDYPGFGLSNPLNGGIEFTTPDSTQIVSLQIIDVTGEETAWTAWFPPGTASAAFPALPTGVAFTDLGTEVVDARVRICEPDPALFLACQRLSASRSFEVTP